MTNLFFSRSYHNRRRFAASKEQKTIQASKKVGVQFKTAGRLQVDPVFNPSKHDQWVTETLGDVEVVKSKTVSS